MGLKIKITALQAYYLLHNVVDSKPISITAGDLNKIFDAVEKPSKKYAMEDFTGGTQNISSQPPTPNDMTYQSI